MPTRAHRALVIGRFQPPHLGHLHLLHAAAKLSQEIVIVVGSADKSHTADNPFTAGERIEMLATLAAEARLPIAHIIPVDDLGRYPLWVAHVLAHVPDCDVVVTGSPLTAHLFRAAGHRVEDVPLVDRDRLVATGIRARLVRGEPVADAVPANVATFLARADVRARLAAMRGNGT